MAEPIYYLTEADLAVLKSVVNDFRRRPGRVGNRHELEILSQAPDVHVARTPASGISALTDVSGTTTDDPGSAFCQIYQITEGTTQETGTGTEGAGDTNLLPVGDFSLRVHNLGTEPVPPNWWVVVARDKFGRWVCLTESSAVYVARTPKSGIPALSEGADTGTGTGTAETSDDVPGSASCSIYRLIGGRLYRAGFSRTVYNLAPVAVAGGNWVVVVRDLWGDWYIPNMGLDFAACP